MLAGGLSLGRKRAVCLNEREGEIPASQSLNQSGLQGTERVSAVDINAINSR